MTCRLNDAINHSGGAPFIYPMLGLLIFVTIMAIRYRGGGGGGGEAMGTGTTARPLRSTGTTSRKSADGQAY